MTCCLFAYGVEAQVVDYGKANGIFSFEEDYAEVSCSNIGVSNWKYYFGAFSAKTTTNQQYSNYSMVAGTTFTANNIKTIYDKNVFINAIIILPILPK